MKVYTNLFQTFKASYMLMLPLSIILQSCLGSIAALYITKQKDTFMIWELAICILVTMLYNAAILAQLNIRLIFKLLILSLISNFTLIVLVGL